MADTIQIYTDGGCTGNPGPGGWAFVILMEGNEISFSGGAVSTTNNKMELTAVIMALKELDQRRVSSDHPVSIHTDSQYVKKGMTEWMENWLRRNWKTAAKKPVKNKEYWQELLKMSRQFNLQWFWVKAHAGNHYNELCDSLVEKEREKFS